MTTRLVTLCFDANDPLRLARFWADALGWEVGDQTQDDVEVVPTDDTSFTLLFLPVPEKKVGQNLIHLDLTTTSLDDQPQIVERLVDIGARHIDIGQTADEGHVVLADPEGNEFCIIEPDNNFLADCGRFGSVYVRRVAGGRLLLERGARMAAGLGSGRGDGNPFTGRHRSAHHVGRPAAHAEDQKEPVASRHRPTCGW